MADLLLKLAGLVAVGHVLYSWELDLLGADKHTNGFMVTFETWILQPLRPYCAGHLPHGTPCHGHWWVGWGGWCKVIIISNPTAVEIALSCIEVLVGF